MPVEQQHTPHQPPQPVAMPPDCTIRSIDVAYQALRHAMRQPWPEGVLSIDCAAIEQADLTFVQLLVSAANTPSAPDVRAPEVRDPEVRAPETRIALHAPPPCVREALARSGVTLGNAPFLLDPSVS